MKNFTPSQPIDYPEYKPSELAEFERWLEGFKEEKKVAIRLPRGSGLLYELLAVLWDDCGGTETIRPVNMQKAMVAFGALKFHKYPYPYYAVVRGRSQPWPYHLFWNKYDALLKMKGRKEYANERELEELDKMASQVADTHRAPMPPEDFEF